jgi:hypothetical protein
MEFQREINGLSAKLQVKPFHLVGKLFFRTQENLANVNVTAFNSLQCENAHFKHAMNCTMWGV